MPTNEDRSYTFVCSECRQSICAVAGKEHAPFDLCGMCLTLPGWFENSELAKLFTHDPVDNGGAA